MVNLVQNTISGYIIGANPGGGGAGGHLKSGSVPLNDFDG